MCNLSEVWLDEGIALGIKKGRDEGRKLGHREGRKLGHREGRKEGITLGLEKGLIEGQGMNVIHLMNTMNLSAPEVMDMLGIKKSLRPQIKKFIEKHNK